MTITIIFFIVGLAIGGIITWLIASSRQQKQYTKQIADLQSSYSNQITELEKRASGAEAIVIELRQQVQQKDSEINQIRNELDVERQSKVEALTKLDASQKSFEEQKAL